MDLSIIIPCYNEQEAIPSLVKRLNELLDLLSDQVQSELIFIDDGSLDDTYDILQGVYADQSNVQILQHTPNLGLGAAIRTGMSQSTGQFVATIDSDCTYDPLIIPDMLEMMEPEVDIITASPYAPGGHAHNVTPFQIFISQTCSRLYRFILRSRIHTFTSMFRIYRQSALETISFKSNTYLCMAEILINAIQDHLNVQEYPAELKSRQYGYSKRKLIHLTFEHFKLMVGVICHKR